VTYLFDFAMDLGRPTPKVHSSEISESQRHVVTSSNSIKIVGESRGSCFRECSEESGDHTK